MQAQQILAFRLARSGLATRDAGDLAAAAACPASDFSRDAALLALAARMEDVTREHYDDAVDSGELVVAHVVRGAIHALAPDADLRKRLFRPVASPGAVLSDGRLVGLWRVKAKGRRAEITVERLGRFARKAVAAEAQRIADLRGASAAILNVD